MFQLRTGVAPSVANPRFFCYKKVDETAPASFVGPFHTGMAGVFASGGF
jgi:hypothetical protein